MTSVNGGRVYFVEQNVGSQKGPEPATGWDSLPIDSNNWIGNPDRATIFKSRPPILGWLHSPRNGGNSSPATAPSLQVKVSSEAVPAGADLGYVTVELRLPGATNDIAQQDLYVDKTQISASWLLPPGVVPNRQYDILVKGRQTLRRKQSNVTLNSGSNLVDFTGGGPLLVGDLNGDNKVNAFDYALLVKHFQPKDPGCADYNRDGTVNSFDWGYMRRNYNKVGDGGVMPASNACPPPTQISSAAAGSITTQETIEKVFTAGSGSSEVVLSANSLSPAVGTTVNVSLTTQISGTSLDGAGILVQFDPGVFQFTGADAGAAFPNFNSDSSQATEGRVELWGLANTGSPISTSGSLATLHFYVLRSIPATSIRALAHAGATTESHAVENGTAADTLLLTNASDLSFSTQGSPARPMPSGRVVSPEPNAVLNGPGGGEAMANIVAEVNDTLNGVREVSFEAYYDGEWHSLGTDDDASDGWTFAWDVSNIQPQSARIRAFVSLGEGVGSYTEEVQVGIGRALSTPTAYTCDLTGPLPGTGQLGDLVAQVGGATSSVATKGNRAYVGIGPRLAIFDVTNPANPVLIGQSSPMPGLVTSIAVDDNYAYVSVTSGTYYSQSVTLRILDVTDPSRPVEVGHYSSGGPGGGFEVPRVTLAGNYVYQGDAIIDVRNKSAPVFVGYLGLVTK